MSRVFVQPTPVFHEVTSPSCRLWYHIHPIHPSISTRLHRFPGADAAARQVAAPELLHQARHVLCTPQDHEGLALDDAAVARVERWLRCEAFWVGRRDERRAVRRPFWVKDWRQLEFWKGYSSPAKEKQVVKRSTLFRIKRAMIHLYGVPRRFGGETAASSQKKEALLVTARVSTCQHKATNQRTSAQASYVRRPKHTVAPMLGSTHDADPVPSGLLPSHYTRSAFFFSVKDWKIWGEHAR